MKIFPLKSGEYIGIDQNIFVLYRKRCKPRVIICKTKKEAKSLLQEYKKLHNIKTKIK